LSKQTFVAGCGKLLRKVERGSALSNKFWLLAPNVLVLWQINQSACMLHIFNPQQMFLLRDKLIAQGEIRETSTKTCKEAMLPDKLRFFVSRISPL